MSNCQAKFQTRLNSLQHCKVSTKSKNHEEVPLIDGLKKSFLRYGHALWYTLELWEKNWNSKKIINFPISMRKWNLWGIWRQFLYLNVKNRSAAFYTSFLPSPSMNPLQKKSLDGCKLPQRFNGFYRSNKTKRLRNEKWFRQFTA